MTCPDELLGLVRRFALIEDQPARRAIADAMGRILDAALVLQDDGGADGPPLTAEQRAVIDYLRQQGVTPTEELARHAGYSVRTISNWCGPGGVLRLHGVVATSRGYAIDNRKRSRPLLTAEHRATLDHLHQYGITSADELADVIGYSANTIKTWCGPGGVLRKHGVVSTRKGYGIEAG